MIVTLLTLVVAALAALGVLAAVTSPRSARCVLLGSAALCGAGVVLAAWALIDGSEPATLMLPIGPPGLAMRLALDPLGACFLLLIFAAGAPCAVFADAERTSARSSRCALPAMLAAMAVTVLAGDEFTLVLGLALLGASGWAAIARGQEPDNAVRCLRVAALGVACLIAVFAVAGVTDYAAMRAAPPSGWRADTVFMLAMLSAGTLIALSSHHLRLDRTASVVAGPAMALSGGAGAAIAIYLLVRLVFDLCGAAQPLWWSLPLLLVGAALAVVGTVWATLDADLDTSLSAGSLQQVGLAIIGLGVVQIARTVDLPMLAELAMSATWLQVANLVVGRTLLLLCAAAAQDAAGTRRLDRLGGLIHRMPVTAVCMLAGLFGIVALPAGLGFAALWLLLQSLLSAARVGGFSVQVLIATIMGLVALSMGLAIMAAVRLFGVAFLGRPRTPRTAAAEETSLPLRASLISLAALAGLLGILPGLALLPARPALAILAGVAPNGRRLLLMLGSDQAGYAALPIAALLAFTVAAMLVWLSRRGVAEHRREPAWSGGFAAPPAWLPFGDPATQISAASFADPVREGLSAVLSGLFGRSTFIAPDTIVTPGAVVTVATARVQQLRITAALRAVASIGAVSCVAGMLAVLALLLAVWLVAS